MKFVCSVILIISALCANRVSAIFTYWNYFTIYGQIIYPGSSHISIEPGSQLILQLDDISITNDFTDIIAEKIGRAIVFPIIFNISYASNLVAHKHLYVLNAKIINKYNELLFVNEKRVEVKPLGAGRTTFIDVPVLRVKQYDLKPKIKFRGWPELIGTDGDDAVNIIKQETGYNEVFVVTQGTQVSKDIRYDRVCVYVDKAGIVAHVPRPG